MIEKKIKGEKITIEKPAEEEVKGLMVASAGNSKTVGNQMSRLYKPMLSKETSKNLFLTKTGYLRSNGTDSEP